MKTEQERAAAFVDRLDDAGKMQFLARLMYELTLAARSCCSDESQSNPVIRDLQAINELQHRLSAEMMKSGSPISTPMPSTALIKLLLTQRACSTGLAGEIQRSLFDALSAIANS